MWEINLLSSDCLEEVNNLTVTIYPIKDKLLLTIEVIREFGFVGGVIDVFLLDPSPKLWIYTGLD